MTHFSQRTREMGTQLRSWVRNCRAFARLDSRGRLPPHELFLTRHCRGIFMAASRDSELIQIVDAALADATRRSGKWLACRVGCTQCCIGVFAINQLDASRLRAGLNDLESREPARAARVRARAREAVARLS